MTIYLCPQCEVRWRGGPPCWCCGQPGEAVTAVKPKPAGLAVAMAHAVARYYDASATRGVTS